MKPESSSAAERKQNRPSIPWFTYVSIVVMACAVIGFLVYAFNVNTKITKGYDPLIHLAQEVNLEVSSAKLLFEKLHTGLYGDEMDGVLANLDTAGNYLSVMIHGGNHEGEIVTPLDDENIKQSIYNARDKLSEIRAATVQVSEFFTSNLTAADVGELFTATATIFTYQIEELQAVLKGKSEEAAQVLRSVLLTFLAIFLVLTVTVGVAFLRLERRRARAMISLGEANDRLQQEISDRILAERRAREARHTAEMASKVKSQFLANMSHELRTPMNGVLGMTELLSGTELAPEQREFVEVIGSSADSLLSVINQIFDFSNFEAHRQGLKSTDFDLRKSVDDVVEMLAEQADQKGLELACLIRQDVPTFVQGDSGRLRQIIMNLAGNAIKFTERGQIATVVSTQKSEKSHNLDANQSLIRFSISDTGIGVPRDKMGNLFKMFSQADASMTRKYGGAGLGLAISKHLAERMGGEIGLESEEGLGSTFWFTAVFGLQPSKEVSLEPVPRHLENIRVLIVDDNETVRLAIQEQLTTTGCHTEKAVSGQEALDRLRCAAEEGKPYDIAVVDLQMPTMNGATLGKEIKKDPLIQDTVLVMLTTLGLKEEAEMFQRIGFSATLVKPVRQADLLDCLRSTLDSCGINEPAVPLAGFPPSRDYGADLEEPFTQLSQREEHRAKARILLAEDNPINQKVAIHILTTLGYETDVASNGKEAILALEEASYDLVLMDIQMPEMDGITAARTIRDPHSRVQNHDIPIVALTAHTMEEDRKRCLASGMNGFLSKPVEPQELAETIKKQLT